MAIVVPKYGLTAVRRNRLKRRVRELARLHLVSAACSCDVLIRARRQAYDAQVTALRTDIAAIATHLSGLAGPTAPGDTRAQQ